MRQLHHVIVGNSAAAIGAVEAIRAISASDPITIISAEPQHCYCRPLIPELLCGRLDGEGTCYRPADFYQAQGVRALLGRAAVAIDPELRGVTLEGGDFVPYDCLLLATGSQPIIPDLADQGSSGISTLNSAADALALGRAARQARWAVVVGGGLVGMKAAEALHRLGLQVTVVELAPRILASAFDLGASSLLARQAQEAGVRIITDNSVVAVQRRSHVLQSVRLADSTELSADLLVLAVGVRPQADLAAAAGLAMDRGILVDSRMQTSAPAVWAAGDVAQGLDFLSGERRVLPLWPVAHAQGRVAGTAMAGGPGAYAGGLSMNSLTLFGLSAMSVGRLGAEAGETEVAYAEPSRPAYRKVVLSGERLVGAVAVGEVDRFGILTGLILEQHPCGFLRDIIPRQSPGLLHLPHKQREEKLKK